MILCRRTKCTFGRNLSLFPPDWGPKGFPLLDSLDIKHFKSFKESENIILDKYGNTLPSGVLISSLKMVHLSVVSISTVVLWWPLFIKNRGAPLFKCYGFPITSPIPGNKPLSNLGQSESEKCLSLQNCHFRSTEWWLSFTLILQTLEKADTGTSEMWK